MHRETIKFVKYVILIFSTNYVWNIIRCKENPSRYHHKYT